MTPTEILPTIIQGGALGLLAIICGIGYKLASQYLNLKSKEKPPEQVQPPRPQTSYDYNEQNARVIYDVSKTLSESVVILKGCMKMVADISTDQKKTFEVLRDHEKDMADFRRRYETRILNREGKDHAS